MLNGILCYEFFSNVLEFFSNVLKLTHVRGFYFNMLNGILCYEFFSNVLEFFSNVSISIKVEEFEIPTNRKEQRKAAKIRR